MHIYLGTLGFQYDDASVTSYVAFLAPKGTQQ